MYLNTRNPKGKVYIKGHEAKMDSSAITKEEIIIFNSMMDRQIRDTAMGST